MKISKKYIFILVFILLIIGDSFSISGANYNYGTWDDCSVMIAQNSVNGKKQELPMAGYIFNEFKVVLTSNSSDINFYYEKIKDLIETEADVVPGAKIAYGLRSSIFPENWKEVFNFNVMIPVRIYGHKLKTFKNTIKITFSKQSIPLRESAYIYLSNNPEVIYNPGLLFWGNITKKNPIRFLYYHMNGMSTVCRFYTVLENLSKKEVKVAVISGKGGPYKDGIFVGHIATKRFMKNYFYNRGSVITIPPEGFKVIVKDDLSPRDINSGIIYLSLLNEGKVRLETVAVDPSSEGIAKIFKTEKIGKGQQRGVFKALRIKVTKYYEVGKNLDGSFLNIGAKPYIKEVSTGEKLKGNYGLWYEFFLEVINKSKNPKIVELFFLPAGGLARGVLFINEKIVETSFLNPYGKKFEEKLITFKLHQNQGKNIRVLTMPQPGVYYPVRLAFREREIPIEPKEVTNNFAPTGSYF